MKVEFWRRNYQWLMAFLIPQAIIVVSWILRRQGWLLAPDVWRMIGNGALLFVVLGLVFVYGWQLTDVGVKRQGLPSGLLGGGLLFIFYAIPQWLAAYPFRWQQLGMSTAYWAAFFLLVAIAEELWIRGLLYTALVRRWNQRIGILGASLAFGLMHVSSYASYGIGGFLVPAISGVAYVLVRAKTDNIIGLIFAHWLLDFMDKIYIPYDITAGMPSIGLIIVNVISLPILWLLLWRLH